METDEKKILIVEDETVIRDAVSAYLERENYAVRGVGDGQSAVEEFQKHSFDLVILDLMLPKLSGERVCRAIRDVSNVPIIMLTAKERLRIALLALNLEPMTIWSSPLAARTCSSSSGSLSSRTKNLSHSLKCLSMERLLSISRVQKYSSEAKRLI